MITAKEVPNLEAQAGELPFWQGFAKLYELSEDIEIVAVDQTHYHTNYIVISAVEYPNSSGGKTQEAFVFPADDRGFSLDMLELPGSIKGTMKHEDALEGFLEHYNSEEYNGN